MPVATSATLSESRPGLQLEDRVRLAHAAIAHRMTEAGVRGLHVKGYAAEPGSYTPGRSSSDVDLLVSPVDAEHACDVLTDHGWTRVTDFAEGSIFEHAATLWHDALGYVDVHRRFPGLGHDPAAVFETLWETHELRVIAGRPVPVPELAVQRLIIVVHGARDAGRGRGDVAHLRSTLSTAEWERMRAAAHALDAAAAWDVATGEATGDGDASEAALLAAMQAQKSGAELLAVRWRAAEGPRERVRLVAGVLPVNRAHLQMRLGRPLTTFDLVREQAHRVRATLVWAGRKVARRGR